MVDITIVKLCAQAVVNSYYGKYGEEKKIFKDPQKFQIEHTEGYYAVEGTKLYIVFQGSQGIKDWLDNFKFWRRDVRKTKPYGDITNDVEVHSGFINQYQIIRDLIHSIIKENPRLGAGGATTFIFDKGEVFGWKMEVQGSYERLLDSVLNHETQHMVIASLVKQPTPRWIDEGAATNIENPIEQQKYSNIFLQAARSGNAIPFNQILTMMDYPKDSYPGQNKMLILYGQGNLMTKYLLSVNNKMELTNMILDAKTLGYEASIRKHYGFNNNKEFEQSFYKWLNQR